jgi:hypothetical protein
LRTAAFLIEFKRIQARFTEIAGLGNVAVFPEN